MKNRGVKRDIEYIYVVFYVEMYIQKGYFCQGGSYSLIAAGGLGGGIPESRPIFVNRDLTSNPSVN